MMTVMMTVPLGVTWRETGGHSVERIHYLPKSSSLSSTVPWVFNFTFILSHKSTTVAYTKHGQISRICSGSLPKYSQLMCDPYIPVWRICEISWKFTHNFLLNKQAATKTLPLRQNWHR